MTYRTHGAFENTPPVCFPDTYTAFEGQRLFVPARRGFLVNDFGTALRMSPSSATYSISGGHAITWSGDGAFTFTPASNYNGTVTLTPLIADPPGASNSALVTIVAVVGGRPGSRASATAQAPPGARCTISYVAPLGPGSPAQGLGTQPVPASERVTWSWVIGATPRPGTGRVTVSCVPGGTASAEIIIG